MPRLILFTIFALATGGALRAAPSPLDPGIPGLWVETTTGPSYVENFIWYFYPSATFNEHVQHTPFNGAINLVDNSSDFSINSGGLGTSNGRLTLSYTRGDPGSGPYVLSDDQSRLIAKYDGVRNAYLCYRYGTMDATGHWLGHTVTPGTPGGLPCVAPPGGSQVDLQLIGPAHWVQPGLAGIWVRSSVPTAANSGVPTSIWVIQPDGRCVIHSQNVTAAQPMDPNNPARDTSTSSGNIDMFGGRFVFSIGNNVAHLTGTYTLIGDELDIIVDSTNQPPIVYKRAGYFNLDGTVHLQ
ncbi:MAG: hypothetical protein ABSE62_05345 [Chthoniobacteraceae bacterium]|jgi:hypothetical protein